MQTFSARAMILDPLGLHVRPAGRIVRLVNESGLTVRVGISGQELVLASAPLRLMALRAKPGQELLIEVDSKDEAMANGIIAQIQKFLGG